MNPSETAKVLAKAALIDNRTVDEMTVGAWHEVVGHLDYRDALRAVTLHFQRSDQYLKPKHVIDLAREARRDREVSEARDRALRALPSPAGAGMPEWFKTQIGRMSAFPSVTDETRVDAHGEQGGTSSASEGPSRAAEGA